MSRRPAPGMSRRTWRRCGRRRRWWRRGASRGTRRRKPYSVWELLPQVEPALTEWAAYFAAGAGKRAAAEAGLPRAASAREADDLLRDAETFLSLAETALGVEVQSPLPLRPAG